MYVIVILKCEIIIIYYCRDVEVIRVQDMYVDYWKVKDVLGVMKYIVYYWIFFAGVVLYEILKFFFFLLFLIVEIVLFIILVLYFKMLLEKKIEL